MHGSTLLHNELHFLFHDGFFIDVCEMFCATLIFHVKLGVEWVSRSLIILASWSIVIVRSNSNSQRWLRQQHSLPSPVFTYLTYLTHSVRPMSVCSHWVATCSSICLPQLLWLHYYCGEHVALLKRIYELLDCLVCWPDKAADCERYSLLGIYLTQSQHLLLSSRVPVITSCICNCLGQYIYYHIPFAFSLALTTTWVSWSCSSFDLCWY